MYFSDKLRNASIQGLRCIVFATSHCSENIQLDSLLQNIYLIDVFGGFPPFPWVNAGTHQVTTASFSLISLCCSFPLTHHIKSYT